MQTLNKNFNYKTSKNFFPATYDHRVWKTGLPVRSAVLKPHAGRLVVGWVTTSESRLLYVFDRLFMSVSRLPGQSSHPLFNAHCILPYHFILFYFIYSPPYLQV